MSAQYAQRQQQSTSTNSVATIIIFVLNVQASVWTVVYAENHCMVKPKSKLIDFECKSMMRDGEMSMQNKVLQTLQQD